jgi:hypothetical protein
MLSLFFSYAVDGANCAAVACDDGRFRAVVELRDKNVIINFQPVHNVVIVLPPSLCIVPHMKVSTSTRYFVRPLCSSDQPLLQKLEAEIFGADSDHALCPHYMRLCSNVFSQTCFVALADGRPVGYLLCFVRGQQAQHGANQRMLGSVAYCTTLAVLPEFQRTRVTLLLFSSLLRTLLPTVETCWFPHQERIQHHAVSRAGRSSPQSRSMFSMAAVP